MPGPIKIKAVDGSDQKVASILSWLQLETFPGDPMVEPDVGHWWIAYSGCVPVAFVGMTDVESWPKTGYVSRVGVLPDYRGNGLQKRLLAVCERKARAIGLKRVISTTYRNPPSANSFVARQYRTYEPQVRWGAEDTIYWIKNLQ
jgi:GNAT superfamily N-acetyltransferase